MCEGGGWVYVCEWVVVEMARTFSSDLRITLLARWGMGIGYAHRRGGRSRLRYSIRALRHILRHDCVNFYASLGFSVYNWLYLLCLIVRMGFANGCPWLIWVGDLALVTSLRCSGRPMSCPLRARFLDLSWHYLPLVLHIYAILWKFDVVPVFVCICASVDDFLDSIWKFFPYHYSSQGWLDQGAGLRDH